jgi:plastocyanin
MIGRSIRLWVASALALVATSCGGGATVEVTLQEFAILPAESSVGAGEVTFEATNEGPDDNHELVVIRTDLAPDALPTNEDGTVDEGGEGIIEVIGEIEEFPPGETQSATFDLEAGAYVFICNVFEEAEGEAHYEQGMRTAFTVE